LSVHKSPELLAPVGRPENFFAALEAGADAVYIGLPGANARNLSQEASLAEIGAMIAYGRARGKKLYLAANSLIFQKEINKLLHTLAVVAELAPDGLIVQDLGLLYLIGKYFPTLSCHASTLMAAHNGASVRMLAKLGCKRVVLARELTLAEIGAICQRAEVDIEVFIHGAMCFSYSGLCLFSSYLGGKSGLRGQCVQPCRRAYQVSGGGGAGSGQKNRGGYLFSMEDLNGLEAVDALRQAGVKSLKIEGRQRSAHYVATVVAAYRRVLDAAPERLEEEIGQARELLASAMTRKTGDGYFFSPRPEKAISPWHSGNLGRYLGRIHPAKDKSQAGLPPLRLGAPLSVGDRLRLHFEPSGERLAFTVKQELSAGKTGDEVLLNPPQQAAGGWRWIDCYLVDVATEIKKMPELPLKGMAKKIQAVEAKEAARLRELAKQLALSEITAPAPEKTREEARKKPIKQRGKSPGKAAPWPLPWWLRIDSPAMLKQPLPQQPEAIVLDVNPNMMRQIGTLARQFEAGRLIAALPPIILDHQRRNYENILKQLRRLGIFRLQLGHAGQLAMFDLNRWSLAADYTFNLMNALALRQAAALGIAALQLAVEIDKNNLRQAIQGFKRSADGKNSRLGLTIYGWPALFTARLSAPFFAVEKPIISPKNEVFRYHQSESGSRILPLKAFSLIPFVPELAAMGLDYCLIDMRGAAHPRRDMEELARRLGQGKIPEKLSSFNYTATL
jgi:putative protease